tara:strand:+ start:3463 stop:5445 length:1983 start_codon:yes stop_codon:yes gene_type:complete
MDKKELQGYLNNRNIQFFLYSILKYESGKVNGKVNIGGHNETSGNSSAFGSQQFIGDTRNEILKKYGVDAWSQDLEEQQLATIALLHRGNQLDNASKGDYSNINDWEAFTDKRRSRLDNRPENWLEQYNSLKSDSVYDPASSWERIPEEMKKQKKSIFDRKYSDVDFVSITTNDNTKNEKSSDVPTAEEAASRQDYTQGTSKRLFEAQSFLEQYAKIENSQLGEADKIAKIAELYRTSPGAKYAIPNYVQGAARIPVGNTGMQDIDIEKLQEGYVDADSDYLLGINEERGSSSLKSLVTKIRRDLNSQGSQEILNRAYKTDQMFSGVPASKLFEYIPEYSNQEGADMNLEPSELDPTIIAKQTPIVLDEKLLQQKPITLKTIRPGQNDTDGVTILTREPVGEGLDEEDEEVYPELTKEQQKQVNKINKQKSKTKFGKLFDIDNEGLKNTLNTIKNSADEAFFALSAGAGIMSVYEATRRDKVTKSHVDPLFKEALLKTREAAQTGMPYEQRQAALKDIANSYSGAMKNVMAISGGQRGAALANIGAVDSSRVNALVDLASKSADMRQKNLDLYSKTAAAYSSQKLNADMTHEQLKQKVEMNRKNNLRAIGLNLFKEATEFSRNYMDISGIEGSGNQTRIISKDDTGSGVISDELSDNLGI